MFFEWAHTAEYIPVDPPAKLPPPKVRRHPMRFLSTAELEAIWASFPTKSRQGQRDRTMFLLLVDTGVRASELVGIRLEDVDLAASTIAIVGKGGHRRFVGLSPTTLQQVTTYARRWRQRCDVPELMAGG